MCVGRSNVRANCKVGIKSAFVKNDGREGADGGCCVAGFASF